MKRKLKSSSGKSKKKTASKKSDKIVENWKGKKVYVIRNKGRIVTWRYVKGSKISPTTARETHKRNGTLNPKIKKQKTKLSNMNENIISVSRGEKIKKPISGNAQYFVQGTYKGKHVVARSQQINKNSLAINAKAAKSQAWENFRRKIAEIELGTEAAYDADESKLDHTIDSSKLRNVREGWVYYTKIK